MLNPQVAQERLKEFATENPLDQQKQRIAALPSSQRSSGYALLGLKADGTPLGPTKDWQRQQNELREAQTAASRQVDKLSAAEQETFFGAFFPRLGALLAAWWSSDAPAIYQTEWNRRPFRMRERSSSERRKSRLQTFLQLRQWASAYQELDVAWFAAWVPYLQNGALNDNFGRLFAAAIDRGGSEGDTIFETLLAVAKGEHEIGITGRHVTRGLLSASRSDGWEYIEKLLLAAQRQEGLRQSILEVVDEAHPEAFRRMLRVIRENDLFRFSATVRAADTWFGMNWVAYEKLSVKQANAATETVETFLRDPAGRDEVLATTTDGQTVYLALWSIAFEDAAAAMKAAIPLLSDPLVERRYAALHLLSELRLPAASEAILSALDDADLRVATKAFRTENWYAGGVVAMGAEQAEFLQQAGQSLAVQALASDAAGNLDFVAALGQVQDWLGGLLGAAKDKAEVEGEIAAKAVAKKPEDDRFERLERNIPRFPAKETVLEPVLWEWDKQTADRMDLANALPRVLGLRPVERLLPYLPIMNSYGRSLVADGLAKVIEKTPARRDALLSLAADASADVRTRAFKALQDYTLADEDAARIEALLTRKAADLRKSVLSLLLKRTDDQTLESAERLANSKDGSQRLAGLDMLTQMVERKRQPDRARAVVTQFAKSRADKLTDAEKAILGPLTNAEHEKPTLENALGLMDGSRRTFAPRPVERSRFAYVTPSAQKIVDGLEAFVEQHKELPIGTHYAGGGGAATLLGNLVYVWQFPQPYPQNTREEDAARLPIYEQLAAWWESRPAALRDPDGWELVRAQLALAATVRPARHSLTSGTTEFWQEVQDLFGKAENKNQIVPILINWLARLYPPTGDLADFYLDGAETIASRVTVAEAKTSPLSWRTGRVLAYLTAARQLRKQSPETWTDAHTTRLWHLLRWADQPTPATSNRSRIADIDELAAAFRIGAATADDLYDQFLVPTDRMHNQFAELGALSGRKGSPLFETTPGLREIVDNCRKRVIEIELRRGDTETAASPVAARLRYTGGMDTLLQLVAALGKDTFARGYSYFGQANRSNVFSHLIRATFPGESETPEKFAAAAKATKIPEKRLIETAVYAPQWARHVEATLGWEGFTQGVWWLHAHTKDNSWSVDTEIREAWTAEIADKTPLSAGDLTEGAVDVVWFKRIYETLGEARWKQIDDAAKYASSAGGHKRAQLYADAMLDRLDRIELLTRIREKRHQDSLRALGLVPLPEKYAAREPILLERYTVMQEFLRTSKQFGAQRQESEKLSVRIGMENLARTAGYPDPVRLTWAMEAAAVADLKDGPVTVIVDEVSVSLSINALGVPELLTVKKGKALASIPPAVKKNPEVAELVDRKTDISRQVSRMRESLEGAMCRGDVFAGQELGKLLEHPVLRPMLRNLVFIEAEGGEPVLGYPALTADTASGDARITLTDCDGSEYTIDTTTALRIAHPYDLLHTGKWERWQKDCFLRERIQPFKQVFRELYVLTEAEKSDATKSLRYSGHQINPKQAMALFNKRGWIGGGAYDYDSDGPRKTFHEAGYTASVGFMGWTASPADVEGSTIEEVSFTKKGEWKSVPLDSVPPRVFSEAMRDLDLVVGVAHVGGVDPEASQSTVEMRAALVREAMALLKIENVRFQKSHAIVDGKLATYNIHLGSAVVHRQPGGYLCIVPVHSQHRGRLFLPFVDDDPRTAEVISKVMLLAKDNEIKDPVILEQILSVR